MIRTCAGTQVIFVFSSSKKAKKSESLSLTTRTRRPAARRRRRQWTAVFKLAEAEGRNYDCLHASLLVSPTQHLVAPRSVLVLSGGKEAKMFHTSRTQRNALYFLHGVPRSFRRRVVPTQLTSTPLRHNTTVALETRRVPRFKWTRRIFWGLLFGGLGYFSTDSSLKRFFHPAEPGSKEDAAKLGYLRKWVDRLPRVQELRLRPNYEEWDAYEDTTDKERRLTSGALKGSRALAVQVSIRRFQIMTASQ